jgi:hypothetical protein
VIEREAGTVERRPKAGDVPLVVAPALVALLTVDAGLAVLGVGLAGLATTTLGVVRGSRRVVTYGGLVLLVSVSVFGATDPRPEALSILLGGALVSWDGAQHVVGLRRQLGSVATVYRSSLVHLGITLSVVTVTGTVAVGVLRAASGLGTVTALMPLVIGVLALLFVLDRP